MSNALFAKNKFGFVDGSIPIPEEGSKELMLWKRCNALIRGWLNSAMDKEIRSSVKYAKTAKEIWDDLNESFGKECAPRAYELKRTLMYTRQENMTVSVYYTKLRGIWDEMQSVSTIPKCKCRKCTCELSKEFQAMREKEQLYEFLMGLDESFGTVKTQILSSRPTPSLSTAYHMVAEDEAQKNISATRKPVVEATAFQSNVRRNDRDNQDQKGKYEPKKCWHCQRLYHTMEECYELIGYPEEYERRGKNVEKRGYRQKDNRTGPKVAHTSSEGDRGSGLKSSNSGSSSSPIPGLSHEQYLRALQLVGSKVENPKDGTISNRPNVNMAGMRLSSEPWIIDSGATEHITYDGRILENVRRYESGIPVEIPNGDNVLVDSIGNTCLPKGLRINRVLNIPEFKCNLLSVSRLTKEFNCALIFFPDFCIMQDLLSRKLIGVGKESGGLYCLEPMNKRRQACSVIVEPKNWHQRLGHASDVKLRDIGFLDFKSNDGHCDSCLRAKQTRLPFPTSSIKTSMCFELLHCDIWGGHNTASFTGAHYFLTIVDD